MLPITIEKEMKGNSVLSHIQVCEETFCVGITQDCSLAYVTPDTRRSAWEGAPAGVLELAVTPLFLRAAPLSTLVSRNEAVPSGRAGAGAMTGTNTPGAVACAHKQLIDLSAHTA